MRCVFVPLHSATCRMRPRLFLPPPSPSAQAVDAQRQEAVKLAEELRSEMEAVLNQNRADIVRLQQIIQSTMASGDVSLLHGMSSCLLCAFR